MKLIGGFFHNVGLALATFIWIIVTYEIAGLTLSSVPTLSRIAQGIRDAGHPKVVWVISLVIGAIFVWFAQWLYYHFNHEVRSIL